MIIEKAIYKMLNDAELMKDPIACATIMALKEYTNNGGKLSELSWFKELNFEFIERQTVEAVPA